MSLSTAERNTLQALTAELIQANSRLSDAQARLKTTHEEVKDLITRRDEAEAKADQFLSSIPVSDAPAEVKPKRKYERKIATKPPLGHLVKLLDTNVNAALEMGVGTFK